VAAGRILNCLNADAIVTCICPASGLSPEVRHRIEQQQITHIDRAFQPSDLSEDNPDTSNSHSPAATLPSMVLCAVDDPAASTEIWKLCRARRIPANIADVPPECDFYFGSTHRDGPLQIMVSTNGNGPRMAAIVRRWVGSNLPGNVGEAIGRVGVLRRKLRTVAPRLEEGDKRMKW
jgi:precorrin-2 dehydrogenase/sirohydrochlorin ferrochelatase